MKSVQDPAGSIALGFALCAYGAFWILSGAHAIKTQRAYSMRRGLFRLRDQPMMIGPDAVAMGKFRIGIGVLLIAIGLWPILAVVFAVLL